MRLGKAPGWHLSKVAIAERDADKSLLRNAAFLWAGFVRILVELNFIRLL